MQNSKHVTVGQLRHYLHPVTAALWRSAPVPLARIKTCTGYYISASHTNTTGPGRQSLPGAFISGLTHNLGVRFDGTTRGTTDTSSRNFKRQSPHPITQPTAEPRCGPCTQHTTQYCWQCGCPQPGCIELIYAVRSWARSGLANHAGCWFSSQQVMVNLVQSCGWL